MAEALFIRTMLLHKSARTMFEISSAGVDALIGATPDAETVAVCAEHAIDVTCHQARQLTAEMIGQSDLVLCMAEDHKRLILSAYPRFKDRVFLLLEYGHQKPPKKLSIDDPTGRSRRKYVKCYAKIEEEIERIHKRMMIPTEGTMPTIAVSR